MQQMIERKTLNKLVDEKMLIKTSHNEYSYQSKYGYIQLLFTPNDLLMPLDRRSPDVHKIDHHINTFIKQTSDMIDCYMFYQKLTELVDRQWSSPELDQRIQTLAATSHASVDMLNHIAKAYYQFIHYGYPTWEHRSTAKEYGISVQTLKKYLKELKLYDPSKQKHQGRQDFNQSKNR